MSFSILLPLIAFGGGFTFFIFKNQKNKVENNSLHPVLKTDRPEIPTVLGSTSDDQSYEFTSDEIWLTKQFICFPSIFLDTEAIKTVLSIGEADTAWFDSVLNGLVEKGVLSGSPNDSAYKLNPKNIETVMNSELHPDDITAYAEKVASRLHTEKSVRENGPAYPWMPFGNAILEKLGDAPDETIALLQNEMGMVMCERGDFECAKFHYSKALKFYEKVFGEAHENTAVLYLNMANVAKQLGDYKSAKLLLEKALKHYEDHFGELHSDTALIYSCLASVLQELNAFSKAKFVLEKLLRADLHNFGETHQNTAACYSDLANVCFDSGDFENALKYALNTLKILRTTLPKGHEDIASMENGIGMIKERIAEKSVGAEV